jgi:hypothetical protein
MKKSRNLGFGVFIDIWSMSRVLCRRVIVSKCRCNQTDQGDETEGLEMEGLETKAVALMNYLRSSTLLLFPNWDISRGFLYLSFAGRISEAAMGGAGDIIFHRLGAQWKDIPICCDFSRFLSIWYTVLYYLPEGSAKLRWAGGGAQRPVLRVFGP